MGYVPKRRIEDQKKHRILAFFKRFFAVIGIATSISVCFMLLTVSKVINYTPAELPTNVILTYHFKSGLDEVPGKPSLSQPLLRPPTTLNEIVDALYQAANDDRVSAFAARISDPGYSLAQYQEIRDAVKFFKASGKETYIFADSYGGFGSGMGSYYLATVFDDVWLQPIGSVGIMGLNSEVPFFRNVLDKLGVTPEMGRRGDYKTAPESMMFDAMTPAHKEMMTNLLQDLSTQLLDHMAEGRGKEIADITAWMAQAPILDTEAKELGLVDHVDFIDVMLDTAKEKAGEDVKLISLTGYRFNISVEGAESGMFDFVKNFVHKQSHEAEVIGKKKIAMIYGVGNIMPRSGANGMFASLGGHVLSASKMTKAFNAAIDDKAVVAIVFRIDSPGGSPVASETVRRLILRAQEKGKPVIVSMGNAAASGGYWVAAPADKIVAQPATLTGSIGVYAGKFVVNDLWQKIGVNWEQTKIGPDADLWSSSIPMDEAAEIKFNKILDHIYHGFVTRVAEGRDMTYEDVDKIAQGRVWTGKQAKELGLVDALGGMKKAIEIAKIEANISAEEDVVVSRYPARLSTIEMFMKLATEGADMGVQPFETGVLEKLAIQLYIAAKPEAGILMMQDMGKPE